MGGMYRLGRRGAGRPGERGRRGAGRRRAGAAGNSIGIGHPAPAETEWRRRRSGGKGLRYVCSASQGRPPSVVGEQRDRHAERLLAAPVGLDPGHQVVPPRPVELPADPAVRVLQRVGVTAAGAGLAIAARNTSRYASAVCSRGAAPAAATTRPADR